MALLLLLMYFIICICLQIQKYIFLKPEINIIHMWHFSYFSSHTSPWVSLHTLALLQLFLRVLNSPAKSSFKGKKCTVEYIGVLTAFYFSFKFQI